MSYKSDTSYRRYANYAINKHQCYMNQIVASIVMIWKIGLVSNYR